MAFQNFYASRITSDISDVAVTIPLEQAVTATSGRLVLEARNPTQREVVKYTGVSGNTVTGVTRGQGGTTAKSHIKNSLIEMNATGEDLQDLYDAFDTFSAANNDWRTLTGSVSSVTANGNHSYNMVYSGVDKTNIISPGMRLLIPRTVAPPTQCASLNGTSQYFSKTSPAGMTFTDDFVVSAWVKLYAYPPAGSAPQIISRGDSNNGWQLQFEQNSAVVSLIGRNANVSNYCFIQSLQSIPLNKWVHITAQLDMSSYPTTSPTTSYIMFDGVDIPARITRAGTNPTSLVQAGNLEVGSWNGGGQKLPGQIAQVAVFGTKQTQADMIKFMNQGLTGSEPGLVSAYSLNNTLNDLNTSNANNLTANGGAVATTVDSPFNATEYGIVMAANFSTDTTLTVQTPEGGALPMVGGVGAVQYSGLKVPYGFPAAKDKWQLATRFNYQDGMANPAANTWYNLDRKIVVPIGEWSVGYQGVIITTMPSNVVYLGVFSTLSTTTNSVTDQRFTVTSGTGIPVAVSQNGAYVSVGNYGVKNTTATPYYVLIASSYAGGTVYWSGGTMNGAFTLLADNGYL